MNLTVIQGQQRLVSLSPNGPLVGQPNWNRISGTCPVDIASDGLSANVAPTFASDTGRTIFVVTAQTGENVIGEVVAINVAAPQASSLNAS